MSEEGLISRAVKSASIRARRRANDLSPRENLRGLRDGSQVGERVPALVDIGADAARIRARFAEAHADYCRNVGHPNHAASLELVELLLVLCERTKPKRVVDLGSGFTSYALRSWAKDAAADGHEATMWSVDTSAEWLGKTGEYLKRQGLETDGLATWPDFVDAEHAPFDIVLHDMGFMDVRAETLHSVAALARPGGLVVLDDMHKAEYRAYALSELSGREVFSLKKLTHDSLARYAYLLLA
jgi:predicted O-methyltransferase YrrM